MCAVVCLHFQVVPYERGVAQAAVGQPLIYQILGHPGKARGEEEPIAH